MIVKYLFTPQGKALNSFEAPTEKLLGKPRRTTSLIVSYLVFAFSFSSKARVFFCVEEYERDAFYHEGIKNQGMREKITIFMDSFINKFKVSKTRLAIASFREVAER